MFKNYSQSVVEKLLPDPFLKIKIEYISGSIEFVFIACRFEGYRNIVKPSSDQLLLPYIKPFFKIRGLELVSMPNFLHDFCRRILSCYILLNDQISLSSCLWEEKELPFKNQFFTRIQTSQLTCFPTVLENLMTDCHKV